jgi:hypothetical protein
VELLLNRGADPNVRNMYSGFTPLHWAAKHGELHIVKLLCEHSDNPKFQAIEYIPDEHGNMPLDYAGFFYEENEKNYREVMLYLIKRMWKKCLAYIKTIEDLHASGNPTEHKEHKVAGKNHYYCKEFLINPVTRSTILYWAC